MNEGKRRADHLAEVIVRVHIENFKNKTNTILPINFDRHT